MCLYPERCNNNLRKMAKQKKIFGGREVISFSDTEWSVFSQKQWCGGGSTVPLFIVLLSKDKQSEVAKWYYVT
jgi:hypothetical protein